MNTLVSIPEVEVKLIEEDLCEDYIFEGYVGNRLYFSINKKGVYHNGEDIEIHVGNVTNVAGIPVYSTKEHHMDKASAYIDVMTYIIKEIKSRWGYEYYGFDSSKFKFVQVNT